MKSFQGRRVLVTGAARGMGAAIARGFSDGGAHVVLADLDADALASVAADLRDTGRSCSTVVLDVTDGDAVLGARDEVHGEGGRIDVLVNNAGVVFGGPFLDVPLDRHLLTCRVNIEGLVAMTHAFLPDLVAGEDTHVVNMASASGFIGLPFGATYAASKWAVIGFSESIRQELGRLGHHHVGVTTVCPGYVTTGMFDGVEAPLLTPFLTPEKVADKVCTAVRRRRILVREPWMVKITPLLMAALPRAVTDRLSDLFGASTSMESWKGH